MKQITILLFLLSCSSSFSQSPWIQQKGKIYTNFSFSSISDYNELFGDPDYNTERFISDRTYQFYLEYGLTDKGTLFANIPFKSIKAGDLTSSTNLNPETISGTETSFGNMSFGYKYNFYNKESVLTGQITLQTPVGNYDTQTGIRTGFDAWSISPLFLAGKSFGKNYVQSFIGADIRTNNYSSNFKFGGEYGRKITQNVWLIGFLDISKSMRNGDIILPQENLATGLYINDIEYAAYGVKGIVDFCGFGITAAVGNAFWGNNVPKQAAFSIGVFNTF